MKSELGFEIALGSSVDRAMEQVTEARDRLQRAARALGHRA